ncbi:FAD-binding oxidoreductase [Sphingobium sp.]|uniref:FAD-binding oxidoreductase n=1 Tax=Sphingobium sp. TaxID=1912891 RepID=UPI0028BF2E20|nr:FAD-binding oxidoreductase [Sphingobium sp.]
MQDILATLPKGLSADGSPFSAVRPMTLDQLHALVAWANDTRCPIVPVSSSGGRHGMGAWSQGAVIADMSGMQRIIQVDAQDSVAIIEPGVTFPALDAALAPHGLRSFKPLLPRRGKSVLASYLDREPITSPHDHWDSEDPLGGTQLVFGNGETFRTGTAAVRGTLEEQLHKGARPMMALGPASTDFLRVVQGSQGTLAIAAWASVFCEPIPARERAFFAGSDDVGPLIDLAYKILWRRLGGQLFIVNAAQLGMIGGRDAKSRAALSDGLPRWILYANLTCPDYFPDERMAYLVADIEADAAALGLSIGEAIAGYAAADIANQQSDLPALHYKDRPGGLCRSLFFLTQMDRAPVFLDVLDAILADHRDIAPSFGVYLQPRIQGVSAHFEVVIPFDPRVKPGDERIDRLIGHVASRLADAGAFFSRPYDPWTNIAFEKDPTIRPYLAAVKELMDPKGILSPGRLCFP